VYIENPKTKGSGIISCIPQTGTCPMKCSDCFFQSGRSYLEPLSKNLPNMPTPEQAKNMVVRVNDGNDSCNKWKIVKAGTKKYPMKFYNTSYRRAYDKYFDGQPFVLTVNPGRDTDKVFYQLAPKVPKNIMFVRVRTNMWNLDLVEDAVAAYSKMKVPIVLTFMRYYKDEVPKKFKKYYTFKKKIINSYWLLNEKGWKKVRKRIIDKNDLVYTCGTEGDNAKFLCRDCGNCLREYFATVERIKMK